MGMGLSAELPSDIVEKVLSLLPVSDLCRCALCVSCGTG